MEIMGVINLVKWIYISWMCEKLFQWALKIGERHWRGSIEDANKENVADVLITEEEEPKKKKRKRLIIETANVKNDDQVQEDEAAKPAENKLKKSCLFGDTLRAIKSTIFGGRVDLSGVHDEDWRRDPKVLSGLSRVDAFKDNGRTKVTSYYDGNNKLVYSKEEAISEPDVKHESFIVSGSGEKFANPAFYVKPKARHADANTTTVGKLDKKFNDMFDTFEQDIPKMARATVDRHINDTLNDLSTFAVGPLTLV